MLIALISPPPVEGKRVGENLGLAYLAAALGQHGYEAKIFMLNDEDEKASLMENGPSLGFVGISTLFTKQVPAALDLAAEIRTVSDAHISIGGHGCAFLWEELLKKTPALDSAATFEADDTIVDLIRALDSSQPLERVQGLYVRSADGITFTGHREPPTDLDQRPAPARDERYFIAGEPHLSLLTSRGCSAHCTFCESGNYGNRHHSSPRWRPRSAENVVAEMRHLHHEFGAHIFSVVDDDFLGACPAGLDRAHRFADLLSAEPIPELKFSIECRVDEIDEELFRRLALVGLKRVFLGVESGNLPDLKLYGKQVAVSDNARAVQVLRQQGIDVSAGFIMFNPLSDLERLTDNVEFLSQTRLLSSDRLTNKLQLYPGSPLISHFNRKALISRRRDYIVSFSFQDPSIAAVYERMTAAVAPFRPLEQPLERLKFLLSTKSPDEKAVLSASRLESEMQEQLVRQARSALKGKSAPEGASSDLGQRIADAIAQVDS